LFQVAIESGGIESDAAENENKVVTTPAAETEEEEIAAVTAVTETEEVELDAAEAKLVEAKLAEAEVEAQTDGGDAAAPRAKSPVVDVADFAAARNKLLSTLSTSAVASPGFTAPDLNLTLDENNPQTRVSLDAMQMARKGLAGTIFSPSPSARWQADGTPTTEERSRQQELGLDARNVDVDTYIELGVVATLLEQTDSKQELEQVLEQEPQLEPQLEPRLEPGRKRTLKPTALPRVALLAGERNQSQPVAKVVKVIKNLDGEVLDRLYTKVLTKQHDDRRNQRQAVQRLSSPNRFGGRPAPKNVCALNSEAVDRLYTKAVHDRNTRRKDNCFVDRIDPATEQHQLPGRKKWESKGRTRTLSEESATRLYENGKKVLQRRHEAVALEKERTADIRRLRSLPPSPRPQKPLSEESMSRLYTQVVDARQNKLKAGRQLEQEQLKAAARLRLVRLGSPPRSVTPGTRRRRSGSIPRVATLPHPHTNRIRNHVPPETSNPSPESRRNNRVRPSSRSSNNANTSSPVESRSLDGEMELLQKRSSERLTKSADSRKQAIDEFANQQISLIKRRANKDAHLSPAEREAVMAAIQHDYPAMQPLTVRSSIRSMQLC
jgi:hypothetical protein